MLLWGCGGRNFKQLLEVLNGNVILNCWDGNKVKRQLIFIGPQFLMCFASLTTSLLWLLTTAVERII